MLPGPYGGQGQGSQATPAAVVACRHEAFYLAIIGLMMLCQGWPFVLDAQSSCLHIRAYVSRQADRHLHLGCVECRMAE